MGTQTSIVGKTCHLWINPLLLYCVKNYNGRCSSFPIPPSNQNNVLFSQWNTCMMTESWAVWSPHFIPYHGVHIQLEDLLGWLSAVPCFNPSMNIQGISCKQRVFGYQKYSLNTCIRGKFQNSMTYLFMQSFYSTSSMVHFF